MREREGRGVGTGGEDEREGDKRRRKEREEEPDVCWRGRKRCSRGRFSGLVVGVVLRTRMAGNGHVTVGERNTQHTCELSYMRYMFRGFRRPLGIIVHARRGVRFLLRAFNFTENWFGDVGADGVNGDCRVVISA